jgi:hypothetical protein
VTLAAGLPGGSAPTSETEFWFDSPHGPPLVAINQLSGGVTAEAVTGGGNTLFGGVGTPVVLNLADGSAYVASGSPPDAAKTRGPGGGSSGTPATAAPVAGGTIPTDATLLGIALAEPDAAGNRSLTATVTDATGNPLGSGTIGIPGDGWWVLGLTPGDGTTPPPVDPPPSNPPPTDPPPSEEPPPSNPPPGNPPPTDGGPVATPEPSTLVLVGIGGLAAGVYRRRARLV